MEGLSLTQDLRYNRIEMHSKKAENDKEQRTGAQSIQTAQILSAFCHEEQIGKCLEISPKI